MTYQLHLSQLNGIYTSSEALYFSVLFYRNILLYVLTVQLYHFQVPTLKLTNPQYVYVISNIYWAP